MANRVGRSVALSIAPAVTLLATGCFSPEVSTEQGTDQSPQSTGLTSSSTSGGVDATGSDSGGHVSTQDTGSPGATGSEDSSGQSSECGDGELDDGEACDDGNELVGDGCNPDCQLSGQELWGATVHGTEERATSMSVRDDDHIFVVGKVGPSDAEFSNWWRTYDPEGVAVATGDLPGDFLSLRLSPGSSEDEGRIIGVEVDGAGGDAYSGFPLRAGAYNLDLTPAWTVALPSLGPLTFLQSFASATPIGDHGGLLVAGGNRQGPTYAGYHRGFARRFDASGSELWSTILPDNTLEFAGSRCFPASSALGEGFVVLCYDDAADTQRFEMRKYSDDGILQFERDLDVSTTFMSGAVGGTASWPATPALAVGADGSIAVGLPFGEVGAVEGTEVFVYDGSGALAWSDTQTAAGGLWFRAAAFLSDSSTVFVGDMASMDGGSGQDALVARFGPSGEQLWTDLHNGSADGDDRYVATAVDSEGNILVYGEEVGILTQRDLVLRKFTP